MPPAAAERTHTAPIDGATTFDSPFSADLLAVWDWESLFLPASGQGGRILMAFQGILCALPLFCGQDCPSCRLKLCPCAVSTARGLFAHKFFPARAGNHRPYPCTWDALRGVGWHLLEGLPGRDPPFTAEPPGGNRRQRQTRQTLTNKSAGAAGGGPAPPEKKQRPAPRQARTQEQGQQKQPTTARPPRSPLMNATRRAGWRRRWPPQRGKEPQGQGEQPV